MIFIANIVAVAVVGFLVLRCGRDQRVGNIKAAHWLRIAGLIPLGLQVLIYLVFGIGEMASGELGGAMHLLEAIVIALLGMLAWMRPLEGGIALFVCGTFSAIGFIVALVASGPLPEGAVISSSVIITAVPQIVSGVLFFIAGMLARSATTSGADQGK
jgi:hypothetical protein